MRSIRGELTLFFVSFPQGNNRLPGHDIADAGGDEKSHYRQDSQRIGRLLKAPIDR